MREPGVDGHVRHDARPVDEAGLRRDEEEPRLGQGVSATNHSPVCGPANDHECATRSARIEFIVIVTSGSGFASMSRYARQMPPAVIDKDVAMSTIVRLAVRTRGSRMMAMPFETASMPV